MKKIIPALLVLLLAICSCGEDRTYQYLELTEGNQWIFSTMQENYFWGDTLTRPDEKKFFETEAKFYSGLLMRGDIYSSFGDSASRSTYGFSFAIVRDPLGIKSNKYYAAVLHVEPGSPADAAGLKRGMWINKIGKRDITSSSTDLLLRGESTTLYTCYADNDENDNPVWIASDTLTIERAREMVEEEDIYLDMLYNERGKTISYIVCNRFGEDTGSKLSSLFATHAASGAEALIIDLRYNSGGSLAAANEAASALAGSSNAGKPFCTLMYSESNAHRDTTYYLAPAGDAPFNSICILTSPATAGSAEAFICAMRNYIPNIAIIGESTYGSIMYTEAIASPYNFTISPAVAALIDCEGSLISPDGILPDYITNEILGGTIYPLGDRQEVLLFVATIYITTGEMPTPITSSEAKATPLPRKKSILK